MLNGLRCFFLSALLATTGGVLATGTAKAESLPQIKIARPTFSHAREFTVTEKAEALDLSGPDLPGPIFAFEAALASCRMSPSEIQWRLIPLLTPKSSLWTSLDKVFPDSANAIKQKSVYIVVDDFTSFAGSLPEYKSYLYYNHSQQVILGLDCSRLKNNDSEYLLPILAHEYTHALLRDKNIEAWFEEGLAQWIEAAAGGSRPQQDVEDYLRKSTKIPFLLTTRRPIQSREEYALSFLFVKYVESHFGGTDTLRNMLSLEASDQNLCAQNLSFLDKATCAAKNLAGLLLSRNTSVSLEKLTTKGLLRYFSVSLLAKHSQNPIFQIADWKGFQNIESLQIHNANEILFAGQFALVSNKDIPKLNPTLEIYRLSNAENGELQMPRLDPAKAFVTDNHNDEDRILVINTTSNSTSLFH